MDVHIEAPGHANFSKIESYYRSTLVEKYSPFEFIKTILVNVVSEKSGYIVKLKVAFERVPIVFVKAEDPIEDRAFKNAMQKLDQHVNKYKSKHYHGI